MSVVIQFNQHIIILLYFSKVVLGILNTTCYSDYVFYKENMLTTY